MKATANRLFLLALLAALAWPVLASAQSPGLASAKSREVRAALQKFVDNQTIAGAVALVAQRDQAVSLEAVGWADLANRKPCQWNADR